MPEYNATVATHVGRRRRQAEETTQCTVEQLKGRDYTEPGFNLELGVEDDK